MIWSNVDHHEDDYRTELILDGRLDLNALRVASITIDEEA